MKIVIVALLFMVACPELAAAAYLVEGDQQGSFCIGVGIESCTFKSIDATVKGGTLYELKDEYQTVDEYHDDKCWIRIRSGILSRIVGDIPTFLKLTADLAI